MSDAPAMIIGIGAAVDLNMADLNLLGGKGRSLALLSNAGLPVPKGVIVTAQAFRDHINRNSLSAEIDAAAGDPATAASRIAGLLAAHPLAPDLETALVHAFDEFGGAPLAVRSSAIAEDSPEHSFAGLQDSFLNVQTLEALQQAICDCWASLWNQRAMIYRSHRGIPATDIAIAVIVQEMVEADVSGVLFTANPATGKRTDLIINANYGLGESIVDGSTNPDTFVVSRENFEVLGRRIAAKKQKVVSEALHGTHVVDIEHGLQMSSCLNHSQIECLAALSLQAETVLDGTPQDIEWVIRGDDPLLVQSRPITNLPPPPMDAVWQPPPGASKLVRRQVVENMPAPLSPLFEDLYLNIGLDGGMDTLVRQLDMPMRVEDFVERPFFVTVNGFGYCRMDLKVGWQWLTIVPKIIYWAATKARPLLRDLEVTWRDEGLATYLAEIDDIACRDPAALTSAELLEDTRRLAQADAIYWFYITMAVGIAKISEDMLARTLRLFARGRNLTAGQFLQGYASNTLAAQTALTAVAALIRGNESLASRFLKARVEDMEAILTTGDHPAITDALNEYFATYGHQVYNLDFVEPTQGEDRRAVYLALKHQVKAGGAPDNKRQLMADRREALVNDTLGAFGPLRRWAFLKTLTMAGKWAPHREQALFYMGAGWPTLRALLAELGKRLVNTGQLAEAQDVYYLTNAELQSALAGQDSYASVAIERKALREARKSLHPPGRVPEDMRFKFGRFDFTSMLETWETQKRNDDSSDTLNGFGVSPGQLSAIATVILSPQDIEKMIPGTILVCPTTTPAWTPILTQAAGLVTDIGAPLAHGSIIAREFGIPAVLGTGNATRRVHSGQLLTIDGIVGTVKLQGDSLGLLRPHMREQDNIPD